MKLRSYTFSFVMLVGMWCRAAHVIAEELVIVSPHWEGIKREYERAFNASRPTPVTFRWLDLGGTSDILRYIKSQFRERPDGIGVDLFFGGGIDPYSELERLSLLHQIPLAPELRTAIPQQLAGAPLRSAQDYWVATAISCFGLVFHKPILARLKLPPPQGWRDLTKPEYFSWIASADPRKSGSAHAIYEAILQRFGWVEGWQILYGLTVNSRAFLSASAQAPHEIALGEVAITLLIDTYGHQARRLYGSDVVGFTLPKEGTVFTGDGLAILKGAPNLAIAEEFVAFALSQEGQQLLMQPVGTPHGPHEFELAKLSVRPDAYSDGSNQASTIGNPFAQQSSFSYNNELATKRWALINDLVGTFLIEEHQHLLRLAAVLPPQQRSTLAFELSPPITEDSAMAILAGPPSEAIKSRNQRITEWRELAESRLQSLRQRLLR